MIIIRSTEAGSPNASSTTDRPRAEHKPTAATYPSRGIPRHASIRGAGLCLGFEAPTERSDNQRGPCCLKAHRFRPVHPEAECASDPWVPACPRPGYMSSSIPPVPWATQRGRGWEVIGLPRPGGRFLLVLGNILAPHYFVLLHGSPAGFMFCVPVRGVLRATT